jgi:hypothetical protein
MGPPERDVTALDEVFRDREQQCRAVAQQLGDLDPAVLAVALVGSCARGALTPDDRDFLVLVDSPGHINRMERMARQLLGGSDTRYSFIFYTRDNLGHPAVSTIAKHSTRPLRPLPDATAASPARREAIPGLAAGAAQDPPANTGGPAAVVQTAIPLYDPGFGPH